MYPTLPFGPLALPTGPILAIFAVILTLDVAGRMARRLRIHPDDLWNVGLLALAAGLIVARLWNAFQFWYIYSSEPLLILSIRPSGFAFWPGVIAALSAGYGYLLWRALSPVQVAAALALGLIAGSSIWGISGHATGAILGTVTSVPWALPYFGELRHPAGLYQAGLALLLLIILWQTIDPRRPGRIIMLSLLGYSLIRIITDTYVDNLPLISGMRVSQLLALAVALVCTLWLARTPTPLPAMQPVLATPTTPPPATDPASPLPPEQTGQSLAHD